MPSAVSKGRFLAALSLHQLQRAEQAAVARIAHQRMLAQRLQPGLESGAIALPFASTPPSWYSRSTSSATAALTGCA
jgi:hypothetical protein